MRVYNNFRIDAKVNNIKSMPHYICSGGCRGESNEPGVCQAEDCLRHSMPLEECDCQDGKHGRDEEESLETRSER